MNISPCRKGKINCCDCVPSKKGRCTYSYPGAFSQTVDLKDTHNSGVDNLQLIQTSENKAVSFVDQKMMEAFNATLTNSAGSSFSSRVEKIWERYALLREKIYRVPKGSVERQFTADLAMEYELLALGKQKSGRPLMFGKLILQKEKNITKAVDIERLIKRRLQMWKDDLLEE